MAIGRPPTPTERKRRLGNPGGRPLPDTSNVVALPPVEDRPPDQLGPAGKAIWEVIAECSWIGQTDRPAVVMLCELFDRRQDFMARLESSDPVLFTEKGYAYANPLVGMLSTLDREIARQLGALGLTPTDRTRMGLAEVKAKSKLQELLENRQRRG
ncbi:phage terminase small subunit P27 family [Streptomyces sp. 1331.2]|uniref:phage terminase small subunit P27 family n=1 Tax=Streptomyces sp. 1331.2 TaxID=1938835 RepID=UPI000BCD8EFE|nr:phage terminase small subunit P27 family [Streptomyces sp. 1331.2]SOB84231.1 phage terminase, small subunit, putative, P27 family [Streptomyces sp. 1331.2]